MSGSIIYGPVPSWRLGRSLGIDLLSPSGKFCSFDCVYCQLGKTTKLTTERREFVSIAELTEELRGVRGIAADYVTFSGMGEPTLASNLGQAIEVAKSILPLPVAVLTNSALMSKESVREDLAKADVVVAKVDAHSQELFSRVNRPMTGLLLSEILESIKIFKRTFRGKLALQMMFIEANKNYAPEMATVAYEVSPDEVQINTPLRPCGVKPLPSGDIAAVQREFRDLDNVVTVYEAPEREIAPLDLAETLRRRPKL